MATITMVVPPTVLEIDQELLDGMMFFHLAATRNQLAILAVQKAGLHPILAHQASLGSLVREFGYLLPQDA